MQRDSVATACAALQQNVLKILDPVAAWIAGIDRLGVPWRHRANQHLVVFMALQTVDRLSAHTEAVGIELRCDQFLMFHNFLRRFAVGCVEQCTESLRQAAQRRVTGGCLAKVLARFERRSYRWTPDRIVHLVADHPAPATLAAGNKIGAATREVGVFAAQRQRSLGKVAVVQADNDAQTLTTE